jgi:hypothetical protein
VVLSTGEFDFLEDNFEYDAKTEYHLPSQITICAPGVLNATLKMRRILEAQNMLENLGTVLRFLAKHGLRISPGYFRLVSDFELAVTRHGESIRESGTTLHEIVLFKPVQQEPA